MEPLRRWTTCEELWNGNREPGLIHALTSREGIIRWVWGTRRKTAELVPELATTQLAVGSQVAGLFHARGWRSRYECCGYRGDPRLFLTRRSITRCCYQPGSLVQQLSRYELPIAEVATEVFFEFFHGCWLLGSAS